MVNCCIYVIERRGVRQRSFYPQTSQPIFSRKADALRRVKELRAFDMQIRARDGSEYRVKDYWDQRPW